MTDREPLAVSLYFWLQALASVAVSLVLVFLFLGRLTPVDGTSMEPTLQDWDWMVVRSIGYTPRQGDVVVLSKEFDDVEGPIVKRIVAVSGQRVDIDYAAGAVSVDGRALEEDYILEPMTQRHWQTVTSLTVPEGCIFVLGDNRNVSNDSRNPALGAVDARYVLGGFPAHPAGGGAVNAGPPERGMGRKSPGTLRRFRGGAFSVCPLYENDI